MPDVKEKIVPPSPPLRIRDKETDATYLRVGFLGEGGFARVYEVQDDGAHRRAVKVISKISVRSKKNKTKLWAEIKLHGMLTHPNIVRFDECFEDEENVYMVLELCENGSMMDLLRRRKRYTEAEARFYLVQLVGACGYMHKTNVIHRDLKLGNLFLDADMNLKVGDLGLAALIENPGDRKKTICGTPNYIAPEVLFDAANGHSFEVDIWSVGVIIYTMLVGKPPFQTKDVKAIYKRIKENRYEFPADKPISMSARDLITTILNPDPERRPDAETILRHPFFMDGPFPDRIPALAHDMPPDFRHLSGSASRHNFKQACRKANIGVALPAYVEKPLVRTALGPTIFQQQKDFQDAVQPDSPISKLLHSAKQPLVRAPSAIREPGLLRKLSAAGAQSTMSPVRKSSTGHRNAEAGPSRRKPMDPVGEDAEEEEHEDVTIRERMEDQRRKELALQQKARILTETRSGRSSPEETAGPSRGVMAPTRTVASRDPRPENIRPVTDGGTKPALDVEHTRPRKSLFETVSNNLVYAMEMAQTRTGFHSPGIPAQPEAPKVFVVSWLDYCSKYGMGFAMADGSVCVHFNDSTSLVLAPGKRYFDSIQPSRREGDLVHGVRTNYRADEYPRELGNKVYLMNNFEVYMMDRLYGTAEYTYEDSALTTGMTFVSKYLRMKHVILFRLSNDVLQFNYFDHTKLIMSEGGLVISLIDKSNVLWTWSLETLLAPMDESVRPRERRRIEAVLHKISYSKDVLQKYLVHGNQPPPASDGPVPAASKERYGERERQPPRPIR